jgi:hypothetical protein
MAAGAVAAIVSPQVERPASTDALLLPVTDVQRACGAIAANF